MPILSKIQKIIILFVVAIIAAGAGYFWYSQKPTDIPLPAKSLPIETIAGSLADNPEYMKQKISEFLIDNPKSNEEYARDIVYEKIAIKENDRSVCGRIITKDRKDHCYRVLR